MALDLHTRPRMDPLTSTAAAGLRSRLESLEMLANNLANASTGGYKADREFYGVWRDAESQGPVMPLVARAWTDFSQGLVRPTGNPLDLAISGAGFFAVDGPGGPLYTRNGSFRLSASGQLVTAEGHAVRAAGGGGIQLALGAPVEISSDGTVRQNGNVAGRLEVADFPDPSTLAKAGGNYFRAAVPPAEARTAEVQQGRIESSNVASAEAAVRLVGVMRQFEMLHRAIGLAGEMNRKAVEEVARVNT